MSNPTTDPKMKQMMPQSAYGVPDDVTPKVTKKKQPEPAPEPTKFKVELSDEPISVPAIKQTEPLLSERTQREQARGRKSIERR
jgi:hypothetical protein